MDLGLSGLASGFDWRSLVDQLADVERAPQTQLRSEQQTINQRNSAFGALKTELGNFRSTLEKLKTGNFFLTRTTSSSAASVATALATGSAGLGNYALHVSQMASAAALLGSANIGKGLSDTDDVSGVLLSSASFPQAITAGKFTVNGKQIEVLSTDSLQNVFDKISAATGGNVTASYNHLTDQITLSGEASSTNVILGSATDTSNFLRATRLFNSATPTTTLTSTGALGGIKTGTPLASAGFAITPTGADATGAGEFLVNGVSITYNVNTDSLAAIIDRINASDAGVIASYDAVNDRIQLTNKVTGDMGVAVEDVAGKGNFVQAAGLDVGTLQRGQDLLYTINGGGELRSQSNTISADSSGIAGLTINVLSEGDSTINVGSDTESIKKAIKDFIEAYNKVQSLIDTQTASSTDSKGKVTAGILASDHDASAIASNLRALAFGPLQAVAGHLRSLEALGISTSGDDNKLTINDEEKLDAALADDLTSVQELFSKADTGVANRLDGFLEKTIGDDGTLVSKQDSLTKQSAGIDTQIADLEKIVESNRQTMIERFLVMEQTQAQINQQLSFLQQKFGLSN